MITNHLKIALRMLRRERGYAFINTIGLAVGLACCMLIVLFIQKELRYDRHHEQAERIFRVTRPTAQGTHWAPVGPPVGPALQQSLPEVEKVARFFALNDDTILGVEGMTYERFEAPCGVYADSTVFDVFTMPLLRGDPADALSRPGTIVLSESMARRFFGDDEPIGRTIGFRDRADLIVTGVMADMPETTHLPIEYMISMATFYAQEESDWLYEARTWAGFYTYLLLRTPEAAAQVTSRLPAFVDNFFEGSYDTQPSMETQLVLQPLTDIHLHSKLEKEYEANGDILYVYVFGIVALFVLLIACVNFINLTTARSSNRMQEVGVRKALGSTRTQLARQFLTESTLMGMMSAVLAYAFVSLALPLLSHLTGSSFTLSDVSQPHILLGLGALAVVTGIFSGLYPAWYMAGFGPVSALRSNAGGRHSSMLRRGLVVFQFALSIFMLAGTATVYSQLQYVRTKALGFDKEQVVQVPLSGHVASLMRPNLESFKAEIARNANIEAVSLASDAPGERYSLEVVTPTPHDETSARLLRIAWGVDHNYARTLGLEITAGRDFSHDTPADTSGWLISQAAADALGLENPLGQDLYWGERYAAPIVGIVEDFHFASLHDQIEPIVLPLRPGVGNTLLVRVRGDVPSALQHIEAQVEAIAPGTPFRYTFLDDAVDQAYRAEQRLSEIFGLFAALAILIASLGLFGLAAYTASQRKKEIGVRKVLGASAGSLVALLSKDFASLVVLGFLMGAPLAYLAMDRWLQAFAYRTGISWQLFLLAGVAVLFIALLTVSYQAIKAALADPVKSLRYE